MNMLQKLKHQSRKARNVFWSGQVIGIILSLVYLFVGGITIVGLIQGIKTFKEDYQALMSLLFIVGIAVGLVVTWFRSKAGAYLMITFIVLGTISVIIDTNRFLPALGYAPFLIPGILLLWFAYIKKEDQGAIRYTKM